MMKETFDNSANANLSNLTAAGETKIKTFCMDIDAANITNTGKTNIKAFCLDKDVTNITTTGKTNAIDLCMPNYSAIVSKSWNTEYTADKAGVVVAYALSDNTSGNCTLTVGGQSWGFSSTTMGSIRDSFCMFVPKGVKYKATNGTSSSNLKFIPLKGA